MLEAQFLGNPARAYVSAGVIFLGTFAVFVLLRRLVFDRLRLIVSRTHWEGDDIVVDLLDQVTIPESLLLALYFGARELSLAPALSRTLGVAVVLVLTYRAARILQDIAAYAVRKTVLPEEGASPVQHETVRNIGLVNGILIYSLAALFALGVLGIKVGGVLTGLGITGVAMALAAQAVLADLFAAVAIFLDRPFAVGDSIMVDSYQGVVEHIGLKTTRVRALTGETIVFPNSALTSAKIRNFQELRNRRVLVDFGISRRTPTDKIRKVTDLVREVVSRAKSVHLDRAHFCGIGKDSFDFEFVYHVLDADYNRYMDLNESIHLAILDGLAREGVDLAYPTRVMVHEPRDPTA